MVGEDFLKALSSILGVSPRNVTVIRLVQLAKASSPILVTLSGIVMLVRLVHLEKAAFPIKAGDAAPTEAGMFTEPLALRPSIK